jgi:UDP-N-acetylmuramate dehydrogenase
LIINKENIRGQIRENFNLSKLNWLGLGGNAKYYFIPEDIDDLVRFLKQNLNKILIKVIGSGSNLLISDNGFDGVVVKLGKNFDYIKNDGLKIIAGGSALKSSVARFALEKNLGGLEFLNCIPGTVAGGVFMNAGCYGNDFSKIVSSVSILNQDGSKKTLENKQINFDYRSSIFKNLNSIILEINFKSEKSDKESILKKTQIMLEKKKIDQPQKIKTGGSTFKNPKNKSKKAWEIIKDCGCEGFKVGNIRLSPLHINFLENLGNATAKDAEALIEKIKQQVFYKSGIKLELELEMIGQ